MSTTPTPRTDEHEHDRLTWANITKFQCDITKALAQPQAWPEFARQLETELAAMTRERDEWRWSAHQGAVYLATEPHSTPKEWLKSQVDASLKLIVDKATLVEALEGIDPACACSSVAKKALQKVGMKLE